MNTIPYKESLRWHAPTKSLRLVGLMLVLLFTATACVSPRIGVSWPSLSTVDMNGNLQILVAYNDQINMINPENGAPSRLLNAEGEPRFDEQGNPRVWTLTGAEAEGAQFFASPVVEDDQLFVPAYNERILEVDILTARPETAVGIAVGTSIIGDIVATPDRFFVPSKSSGVLAIDRETYDIIWNFPTEDGVWAPPLLADEVLYFGSIDHRLYAVDANNGELIWDIDLEGAVASTPILVDDMLYVGSFAHKLYKISRITGEIIGEYLGSNWIWSSPVYVDGVLYYADLDGYVYAINANTMQVVWSVPVAERGIRPSPLVVNDLVIAASRDGHIYWLDIADGTVVFDRELEGTPEILSDLLYIPAEDSPADGEALVIVGTADTGRLLAAYTIDNGRAVWAYGR